MVVDKFLVLSLGWVKLGELVALIVWSDIESGKSLVATDQECTLDDRVVSLAIDRAASKEILPGSLEAGEEAT